MRAISSAIGWHRPRLLTTGSRRRCAGIPSSSPSMRPPHVAVAVSRNGMGFPPAGSSPTPKRCMSSRRYGGGWGGDWGRPPGQPHPPGLSIADKGCAAAVRLTQTREKRQHMPEPPRTGSSFGLRRRGQGQDKRFYIRLSPLLPPLALLPPFPASARTSLPPHPFREQSSGSRLRRVEPGSRNMPAASGFEDQTTCKGVRHG